MSGNASSGASTQSRAAVVWRTSIVAALMIFLVAFLVRMLAITVTVHYVESEGAETYVPKAVAIATGQAGVLEASSPLYPAFLASIYSAWGEAQTPHTPTPDSVQDLVMVTQAVVGALGAVLVFLTFRLLFNGGLSFIIGLVVACYVPLAVWGTIQVRSEGLSFFWVSVVGYLTTILHTQGHLRLVFRVLVSCALAASLVLLILNHPLYSMLPVIIAIVLMITPKAVTFRRRIVFSVLPVIIVAGSLYVGWSLQFHAPDPRSPSALNLNMVRSILEANAIRMKEGLIDIPPYCREQPDGGLCFTEEQLKLLEMTPNDNLYEYSQIQEFWRAGNDDVLRSWALQIFASTPLTLLTVSNFRIFYVWVADIWVNQNADGRINIRPSQTYREDGRSFLFALSLLGYGVGAIAGYGMVVFWWRALGIFAVTFYVVGVLAVIHANTASALPVHPYILGFSVLGIVYGWRRYRLGEGHDSTIDTLVAVRA